MDKKSEVPSGKSSDLYADQISGAEDEKIADVYLRIRDNSLPRYGGKLNILELGTGGGDSFSRLKELVSGRDDIDLYGTDGIALFARRFIDKTQSSAIVADAGNLAFRANAFSAINASAVFHEISTYGVINAQAVRLKGRTAVMRTLEEITRILLPGGMLAYRDVSCPHDREALRSINYFPKSWHVFIGKYLPRLIETYEKIIGPVSGRISVQQRADALYIEAPGQIHREIQRHYITFRDYFRKAVAPHAGLDVTHEEWIDQPGGVKIHTVAISSHPHTLTATIDSNTYDSLTDALINDLFDSTPALDDWFKREGTELYTLLSADELIALTGEVIVGVGPSYGFVSAPDSIRISPRDYYQRYLRQAIDNPELEAKQHIQFIKTAIA